MIVVGKSGNEGWKCWIIIISACELFFFRGGEICDSEIKLFRVIMGVYLADYFYANMQMGAILGENLIFGTLNF